MNFIIHGVVSMSVAFLLLVLLGGEEAACFQCYIASKRYCFSSRTVTAHSSSTHNKGQQLAIPSSFQQSMVDLGYSNNIRAQINEELQDLQVSQDELIIFARDFVNRPETFSQLLQSDFGIQSLTAHRIRAIVMNALLLSTNNNHLVEDVVTRKHEKKYNNFQEEEEEEASYYFTEIRTPFDENDTQVDKQPDEKEDNHVEEKRPIFKHVVVNERAKLRKQENNDNYGLQSNYQELFPQLGTEMNDFYSFMTQPSTISQESPIRPATANVYLRHAKLFLGWWLNSYNNDPVSSNDESVSLYTIVPDKSKESANSFLDFILWLRSTRSISVSYEANLLRGLTKLLKFRFARESAADPSYGDKSFQDIPLIREVRKLHRDAHKRQSASPRSSDEEAKWLTWTEFLNVIEQVKHELLRLLEAYEKKRPPASQIAAAQRKIATCYQYYLVLAFFSCVPDRQRTIRELEIGKSFVKDQQTNLWVIKHGPDDYKTGKTYGERPPLMLSANLVPAIDDFIERWRSFLNPRTNSFFVQPRTGKPLTQDSVYQIVARNCYTYSGKKTNPHLLRDMIVTHVRDSEASEKQLEALALFMGHSIQMQRSSYDRRTLTRKVAPAVELMLQVNQDALLDKNSDWF